MKNGKLCIWLALIFFCVLGLVLSISCDSSEDDEEDDEFDGGADDDDTTDDDSADDDTTGDDDDTTDDDDDTTDDDDSTGEWDFYYENIEGLAPIGNGAFAGNIMGHDVVAALAILAINGGKTDSIEWDMLDGLAAGSYQFNIAEGENPTGAENPTILVAFGLSPFTGTIDKAYYGVSGDAQIDATGLVGDHFSGACTNVEFRPINITSGAIDWSGPKGFVENFAVDTKILGLTD